MIYPLGTVCTAKFVWSNFQHELSKTFPELSLASSKCNFPQNKFWWLHFNPFNVNNCSFWSDSPKTPIFPWNSSILSVQRFHYLWRTTFTFSLIQDQNLSKNLLSRYIYLQPASIVLWGPPCSQRETISPDGGDRARPTRALITFKLITIRLEELGQNWIAGKIAKSWVKEKNI